MRRIARSKARVTQPAISPTQVSLWRLCKRKFAFTYLTGEPRPPPTRAQLIGTALHARAEQFFLTGAPDFTEGTDTYQKEAARLFPYLVDFLPPGASAEQKLEVVIHGVRFAGRYDWFRDDEVGDLKTTSDLKWAKSASELMTDPQALIYSAAFGAPTVPIVCRWVYVQTKGKPRVREVRFTPDFSALPELVADGRAITQVWKDKPAPNDLEPNTSACDAFGGCPFRGKCHIDPCERLISLQKRMGLLGEEKNMGTQKTFEELMAEANGIESVAVNPPQTEIPPALDTAPAEAAEEQPKAKRVRKPRDTDPAPAPTVTVDRVDVVEAVSCTDRAIGTLFLSCMPFGLADLEHVEYIIAAVRAEISEKLGIEDYRLAEFGKGAGYLVAGVCERVAAIRPKALYVDVRSPEGRILAGPLMALADLTIQGT